jgi:hypothetical protein
MKNKKIKIIAVSLLFFSWFFSPWNALGYFDTLSFQQAETIPIGDWDYYLIILSPPFDDDFTNQDEKGSGTVLIGDDNWEYDSVIVGNRANDQSINGTSLAFVEERQTSYISTLDAFKGVSEISFYLSKTTESPDSGREFYVKLSLDGTQWETIETINTPANLTKYIIDVYSLIENGLTINGTSTSHDDLFYIMLESEKQGGNPRDLQQMNVDEIEIRYSK